MSCDWNVTGLVLGVPHRCGDSNGSPASEGRTSHVSLHGFTGKWGERGADFIASLDGQGNALFQAANLSPKK